MDNKRPKTAASRRDELLRQAAVEKCTERILTHTPPSLKLALAAYALEQTHRTGERVTSGSLVRGWIREKLTEG